MHSGGLFANPGARMLFSGLLCIAITSAFGKFTQRGGIEPRAWLATGWVICGSCIAFASLHPAKVWHSARAGSYSYLTPVIAVLLG